ncbi:hypothetical protein Q5741_14740 [Paenibacillus sp. JX-17]|uniref:Sporulation protein n=1 Tax=Paenibacillus lacisoli TaxID=3064525 RepID=A0ABT9CEH6_9BACL|nr:hypothetical protein [Paenibacillus sp. JX-17]MDO7907665.1 hypothetical protein [Paenibacillus sp. JX-17]
MKWRSRIVVGTLAAYAVLMVGCANHNVNTATRASESHSMQAQNWGDPKQLEASHLDALKRLEKDHVQRIAALNTSTDSSKVLGYLDQSDRKLGEMKQMADILQQQGYPALAKRMANMSKDIHGSKSIIMEMKKQPGMLRIQSAPSLQAGQIHNFHDYHRYLQQEYHNKQ